MYKPKVLLTTLNSKYIHPNLAIRLLYCLNKDYNNLTWTEFTIKEDKFKIADYCKNFDIVAFSCYIWNISQTLETSRIIKQLNPNTKILLGGPEVSYEWEEMIIKSEVDYIITGEGEIPFSAFLKNYPNATGVPSLVWKENNIVKNNPPPPLFDLKEYENIMPYEYDNPEELQKKVLYIETSRGCPYKCEFCLASLDNKVRYLPDKHIKNTLAFLMNNGKVIKFLDRTFNIKKDFTLDIFQFILANRKPGNVFQFEITADILHPDIIQFINEQVPKGLFRFEIGIQTINQQANLAVSRKQNFEKTKKIIKQVEEKVELHLDLIMGMAHDYWDDAKKSFEETFSLLAPELQFGFLKFLKGTPVREKHKEHEFLFDQNPPYEIISSKYLSKEELNKLRILENALEIYWNGKKSVRTLTYVSKNYSIFDFLLKLGETFNKNCGQKQYSVIDIYRCLNYLVKRDYPTDAIMLQLVHVDYYTHFRTKPAKLSLDELPANTFPDRNKNQQKRRNVILKLNFSYKEFIEKKLIKQNDELLVVSYTGTQLPELTSINIA